MLEYKAEDCPANLDGKSVYPTILTALSLITISFGTVSSQLPPASEARSITTEPGFMAATWVAGHRFGAFFPGIRAVEITISTSLAYFKNISI